MPGAFTSQNIVNRSAGTYSLVVTDANGCSVTDTFTIVQPLPFNISAVETDVQCFGDSTGSIAVTVLGATPPYSYYSEYRRYECRTEWCTGRYLHIERGRCRWVFHNQELYVEPTSCRTHCARQCCTLGLQWRYGWLHWIELIRRHGALLGSLEYGRYGHFLE